MDGTGAEEDRGPLCVRCATAEVPLRSTRGRGRGSSRTGFTRTFCVGGRNWEGNTRYAAASGRRATHIHSNGVSRGAAREQSLRGAPAFSVEVRGVLGGVLRTQIVRVYDPGRVVCRKPKNYHQVKKYRRRLFRIDPLLQHGRIGASGRKRSGRITRRISVVLCMLFLLDHDLQGFVINSCTHCSLP